MLVTEERQAAAQVRPGRGPLIGYLHDGGVYASNDSDAATFDTDILLGNLFGATAPRKYVYWLGKDLSLPYRWRIAFGCFWAESLGVETNYALTRFGMSDLDLFESADVDKTLARVARRYPWDPKLTHKTIETEPIAYLARDIRNKTDPSDATRTITEAYFDFLPTAATKMTLFILYEKKIRSLEGEFTLRKKPSADWATWWDYKWAKKPTELARANFHAPFILYQAGKDYYFLTQLCECHGLKDDGKGGRETVALWAKEDQPIARLITDTATGKTFAFTLPLERKDGTKAKPGYFELGPKPELIEYDPAKVKKTDYEYPYKQIRECVDILLADKKIDPEKQKPKERK